jgi:transcriptional regulator with XRE-family HTH domain
MNQQGFQESSFESEMAKRIRFLMWRDNLNQNETCARCKMNVAFFSGLLKGRTGSPTLTTLGRIANAFNVNIGWLLGEGDINDQMK